MRLRRVVATGLVMGAGAGFAGALLRPRDRRTSIEPVGTPTESVDETAARQPCAKPEEPAPPPEPAATNTPRVVSLAEADPEMVRADGG